MRTRAKLEKLLIVGALQLKRNNTWAQQKTLSAYKHIKKHIEFSSFASSNDKPHVLYMCRLTCTEKQPWNLKNLDIV